MTAHRRLAAFREEKELTYRQLAKLLGIHFTYAHALCSGARSPSLSVAIRVKDLTTAWRLGPIEPEHWAKRASA